MTHKFRFASKKLCQLFFLAKADDNSSRVVISYAKGKDAPKGAHAKGWRNVRS